MVIESLASDGLSQGGVVDTPNQLFWFDINQVILCVQGLQNGKNYLQTLKIPAFDWELCDGTWALVCDQAIPKTMLFGSVWARVIIYSQNHLVVFQVQVTIWGIPKSVLGSPSPNVSAEFVFVHGSYTQIMENSFTFLLVCM